MATLQIIEYASLGNDASGLTTPIPQLPPLATQNITFTGTAGQSNALNKDTRFVCLIADANYRFAAGSNPTATSSSQRHPADAGEYFGIDPASLIAAVTA